MKIQPVGAELFHADRRKAGMERQTDGRRERKDEAISRFLQFCERN